jgi:hypothetical protein
MNVLYVDNHGIEWKFGHLDKEKPPVEGKNTIFVWFPIKIKAMHPTIITDPLLDYIYCSCVKCHSLIKSGILCLEFGQKSNYGLCLLCTTCCRCPLYIKTSLLIIELFDRISQILIGGCNTYSNQCIVCDKSKCKSLDCKTIIPQLYNNNTEIMLEHFYKIKLNVLSLFTQDYCSWCNMKESFIMCNTCKLRFYCGKKCKKLDKNHACIPYYDMWRNNVL